MSAWLTVMAGLEEARDNAQRELAKPRVKAEVAAALRRTLEGEGRKLQQLKEKAELLMLSVYAQR